ncbi:phosphoinositide phospholipase C 2-like [Rhodamnia argentea]|uniref:Phosphoinositide phospholipase C n=1 Tax=Rhodamnia argentea TaxID=178133 RepID=A0A8B8NPU0_9MYRT|nr:phosphoinositide phospholipase C 2-like [Rhodamnia argentea]
MQSWSQAGMSRDQRPLHFRIFLCFGRKFHFREVRPPHDVQQLFEQYSENGTMTVDHLRRFLVDYQMEKDATREDASSILHSLRHHIMYKKELNLDHFFRYLLSDHNPPVAPSLRVHHDMNAPLAHYYMYTGHNSYLTGNQLSSDSSFEPIVKALKKGVRVIELDLWPNSRGDKVKVCHGGTLTSPVDLNKCLHATKEHAFAASKFPVVITFEDHLTPRLQAKVAKMVTKTFQSTLHRPDPDQPAEFPSPESLKGKILISTKPPKEYLESQTNIEEEDNTVQSKEHSDNEEYDQDEEEKNAIPEYKHLIAIHAGKPKGRLVNCLRIDMNKVGRLSLSEQELEEISRTHGQDIVRFTQRNLLRIYPKGTRVDSSNYNPLLGWMHGAQMVAFNMQGYGKYLWIMQGMFRGNGWCGYVKKPDFLLDPDHIFDPSKQLRVKKTLKVMVYLGEGWHLDFKRTHFDQFSPPDFFVRVGIAGVPADTVMTSTKAIEDDWTPVWDEEFKFPLTVPELAILRIEVLEYDTTGHHDFGGQTCLPVSELREGIRAVPLHGRKGDRYRSVKLLMRFKFLEPSSELEYDS